jgi:hypothetical protein
MPICGQDDRLEGMITDRDSTSGPDQQHRARGFSSRASCRRRS